MLQGWLEALCQSAVAIQQPGAENGLEHTKVPILASSNEAQAALGVFKLAFKNASRTNTSEQLGVNVE